MYVDSDDDEGENYKTDASICKINIWIFDYIFQRKTFCH